MVTGLMLNKCNISDYADLLAHCKAGSEEAFRCIFDHYYIPVKNNIAKFVDDSNSAADILQDVFLTFWEKKLTLPDDTNIEGWLFTVSYYKSVSFIRKSLKGPVGLPEDERHGALQVAAYDNRMEEESLYVSQLQLLNEGIAQLSPQKKTAFILYKVKGCSYLEISQQMGISEMSARQYVKMSLHFLKKYVRSRDLDIAVLSYVLFFHGW